MDDPVVRDAASVEDLELVDEIAPGVGRREQLAHPVGPDPDRAPDRAL
jgi:hypothetical protein